MTLSRQPQISEELLSAYLDDQVTAEERILVEKAIATDPAVAWQVDSLRQTIHLLQELPPLTLPRSFSLEAILAEVRTMETPAPLQAEVITPKISTPQRAVVRKPVVEEPEDNWLQWFLRLWQGGNLQLRNAAAVAMTLFFVLFAGDRLLVSTQPMVNVAPAAALAVPTSDLRVATEAPAAPVAEPTPTSAPTVAVANQATESQDQAADGTTESGAAANTFANTPAQPETSTLRVQGATSAPPGDRPGPVEADLTGDEGSTSGGSDPNADAPTAFHNSENSGREEQAKSVASMSAVVAANDTVTQASAIAAELPVTTPVDTASMRETVTAMGVISETAEMTTSALISSTFPSTSTVAEAAPLMTETPTVNERVVWLTWAQIITALSTVVLAGFWWRSRG